MSSFTFDLGELLDVREHLARAPYVTQDRDLVAEVNKIVDDIDQTARSRMNAGINLSDAYLRSKMSITYATAGRGLVAEITARGGKGDQTPLGRYFNKQETKGVNWRNDQIRSPFEKWPGWTQRTGDKSRGIPANQKAAGISVQVTRGAPKLMPGAFTMPLRAGNRAGGNGLGIFLRTKYGLVQHTYGPAVYQLFRYQVDKLVQTTGDTLEQRLAPQAQEALLKVIR